ncbi:MAG: anion transporter [Belnapia sp.]|nr:anion transporter [Belnapia sp.]
MPEEFSRFAAVAIFLGTYAVVAVGRVPRLRLDRTGAAVLGAALMIGCGALTEAEAFAAVDLGTLALLFGMMLLVANLRLAGFFRLVTVQAAARARHPATLLAAVVLVSGGLSAVLVNDTVCLAVTPLVVALARHLRRDPLPYLLAVAMAANVGSAATITGNPQNMLVGGFSGLAWGEFALALGPVAALGLVATFTVILLLHPGEFFVRALPAPEPLRPPRLHRPLVIKSALVATGVMVAFLAGVPVAVASLLGGTLLLLTRRVKPEKLWREVDWPLLALFAGLFVVVAGLEHAMLTPAVLAAAGALHLENPLSLTVVTTILSSLVSNVPAVLVLKPFIEPLADPPRAWLIVAMASTMAGNLTLVGSVANLIVAQRAAADGVTISFWRYARTGVPVTLATLAIGLWLR